MNNLQSGSSDFRLWKNDSKEEDFIPVYSNSDIVSIVGESISDVTKLVVDDFSRSNIGRNLFLKEITSYKYSLTLFSVVMVIILIVATLILITIILGYKSNVPLLDSVPAMGSLLGTSILLLIVINNLKSAVKIRCALRLFSNKEERLSSSMNLLNLLSQDISKLGKEISASTYGMYNTNSKIYNSVDKYNESYRKVKEVANNPLTAVDSFGKLVGTVSTKLADDRKVIIFESDGLLSSIKICKFVSLVLSILMPVIFIIAVSGAIYYFLYYTSTNMWLLMVSPVMAVIFGMSSLLFNVSTKSLMRAQGYLYNSTKRSSTISSNMYFLKTYVDELKKTAKATFDRIDSMR